uniref:Uncharacterized protein n=1 Tax=Caenorhabditis japonica TaxID=281687 RepID=A0A8R1EU59_CAEJA
MNDEEDSVIRDIEQLLNYKSELCGKLLEAELDLEQANKYLDDRGLALQHYQQQEDMTKARIQLALGDINRVIVEFKERTRQFFDDIAQTVSVLWRKMERIESLLHEALRAVNELAPTREQVNERLQQDAQSSGDPGESLQDRKKKKRIEAEERITRKTSVRYPTSESCNETKN